MQTTRVVKGLALGVAAFTLLYLLGSSSRLPPAPKDTLSAGEVQRLFEAMVKRVQRGGPNHLHMRRLYYAAPVFARAAGASVDAVRAAALLHDTTKEDGRGEPRERFCTHGEQGAEYALTVLRGLGKSEAFALHVARAVREHMGPCGHNEEWKADRFMTKFCAREYPAPVSLEAQVLYDIDMLDLMTVDGVVKVVELRQKGPEFGRESLEDSARKGPDSAWKSVVDARQTLITSAAVACGGLLEAHSKAFLDQVDWRAVSTVDEFKAAARAFVSASPRPACLPQPPGCREPDAVIEEGPDARCEGP